MTLQCLKGFLPRLSLHSEEDPRSKVFIGRSNKGGVWVGGYDSVSQTPSYFSLKIQVTMEVLKIKCCIITHELNTEYQAIGFVTVNRCLTTVNLY